MDRTWDFQAVLRDVDRDPSVEELDLRQRLGTLIAQPGTEAEPAHIAGIDCGSAEYHVAVPLDRDATPVRAFKTFTGGLYRVADWLATCHVTSVATESTGVYWIPLFEILEARSFEVGA